MIMASGGGERKKVEFGDKERQRGRGERERTRDVEYS
jgi:hypothetical protein